MRVPVIIVTVVFFCTTSQIACGEAARTSRSQLYVGKFVDLVYNTCSSGEDEQELEGRQDHKGEEELLYHVHEVQVQTAADVTTPTGRVIGLELDVIGRTVNAFLGIPFAQPPVGELRFRRAEPIEPWKGTYHATRKPSACMQDLSHYAETVISAWAAEEPVSEDCLYLNVWQPTPVPTGAAVMVWIHGGGYQIGSSSLDMYDGRYLAASEGVIVVSLNYRLSTLGFLYAGTDEAPGNMGLTDQILALTWVKENIASFGGDPAMVTPFGESVGGVSIGYMLLSSCDEELFKRAILQSGATVSPFGRDSKSDAFNKTRTLAESIGCPVEQGATAMLACLREKDGKDLTSVSVLNEKSFYPVLDGEFLPTSPADALRDGKFKKSNIIIGSTANDGTLFLNINNTIDKEQFIQAIRHVFPDLNAFAVDAAVYQYITWTQASPGTLYRDAMASLFGDYGAFCPDVTTARAHVKHGARAYMYQFAHRVSNSPWPEWMGVVHGAELEFVFGRPLDGTLGYTKAEVELSRRVMHHWANFARTGNPNNNENNNIVDIWSPFKETDGGYMVLDTREPRMMPGPRTQQCAFWDDYVTPLMAKTDALLKRVCEPTSDTSGHPDTDPGD